MVVRRDPAPITGDEHRRTLAGCIARCLWDTFLVLAVPIAICLIIVLPPSIREYRMVEEGMEFCDSLIDQIEGYRADNGEYPDDLSFLGLDPDALPAILNEPINAGWYETRGDTFWFRIWRRGGGLGLLCPALHAYSGEKKEWYSGTG